MKYTNPVILSDYSDPDVIRVGDDFYMVASSFNHLPGVPVLHSKNLVEWEIINHVIKKMPFPKFDKVCHGHGAWAPSIRYHDGRFYCLIPFPDEGIFVADTDDIYGEWSPLRPLIEGAGYEDPCPMWKDGKCYVVMAFVRSRIGFNSKLAVFETDERLQTKSKDYKIIYSHSEIAPWIEGPKFYEHGGYIYILAPVGGVGTGWQVALCSKEVYGPYETKIIMVQGDSSTNGPHQGALIDLDDKGEKWAFMHFQQMGAFGRVVHLQPAEWADDWVICGKPTYDNLPGNPVSGGEYPVQLATSAKIEPSDEFDGDSLSLIWQTPANPRSGWYSLNNGLRLNCAYYDKESLSDLPQLIMQKVSMYNFTVCAECALNLKEDGDEVGITMFGKEYGYVCIVRRGGANFLEIRKGNIGGERDVTLVSVPYAENEVVFTLTAGYEEYHKLSYKFGFVGGVYDYKFYATPGVWVGAKLGMYARSSEKNGGYATFKYFRVKEVK